MSRVPDLPRDQPVRRRHRLRRVRRLADRRRLLDPADRRLCRLVAAIRDALRALPERQRQYSLLPLLHNYQRPQTPLNGSMAPTDRFRAAVQDAKIGPDKDIPHVSQPVIVKYVTDLQLLGLL